MTAGLSTIATCTCLQANAHAASVDAVVSNTFTSKQEADTKADAYERRLASAQHVVEELKKGISSLFQTAVSTRAH